MFSTLCSLFDKIQSKKCKSDKLNEWKNYFKCLKEDNTDVTYYDVMRLALPKLDSRKSYGLKENTLAKKYINILCLSRVSIEAQRLLKYKSFKGTRDFPDALYSILKVRCNGTKNYSISDINLLLDNMQSGSLKHNEQINTTLETIVGTMPAIQQKWFCKIVLKDLHLGMSEKSLLCCMDSNAEAAFNVCSDLKKICENLGNLETLCGDIAIGRVFKPMLADRVGDLQNITSLMKSKPFYVETKYDGERMQIHKRGNEFLYYSRGCKEYSDTYGKTKDKGTLTPQIHNMIDADSCIIDGEIIVYDTLNQILYTKAQGVDARNLSGSSTRFLPCFIAFDIVYYNNKSLITMMFSDRRNILEQIVRERVGYIYLSKQCLCSTYEDVLTELNNAIDRNDEGLVLKVPGSLYMPDQRIGGWYKVKPDYLDLMNDSIDVVILGGYYGSNTGSGTICHYLCGIASASNEYSTFCKVKSGITKDDLNTKLSKLEAYWLPFEKHKLPQNVKFSSTCREKPSVVIDPCNSMVIEIRAAELMGTSFFALPLTARFPRVVRVREDKAPSDCTKFEELKKIQSINKRGVLKVEPTKSPTKRRKLDKLPSSSRIIPKSKEAIIKSKSLVGKMYCILSSSEKVSKQLAETFIKQHSGEIVSTPIDRSIVLCGKQSISVKNILKHQKHLVVDISWICLCESKNKVIPCPPHCVLFCPEYLKTEIYSPFDEFGDSYTEPISADELKVLFARYQLSIKESKINHPAYVDVKLRYPQHFSDYWRFALKEYVILIPDVIRDSPLMLLSQLHGARFTTSYDSADITHIYSESVSNVGKVSSDGTEKQAITKSDLLELLKPYISDNTFSKFS